MHLPVLGELVIVLAASIAILLACHRLRIPPVTGFLLTGVMIGPSGLGLIRNARNIDALAEVGVVMLLFMVGLEFSLEALRQFRKNFLVGGSAQVLATVLIVSVGLRLLGMRTPEAIMLGFLLTHTSTTVILKIFSDRGEGAAPQVRIAVGISMFQDISFVPMAALVPVLASAGAVSLGRLSWRLALSLAVLTVVFLVARYIMPEILFRIVRTRLREMFVLSALFICLGMALLSSALGLSLALGAFLAGIAISESNYSHQVVSDILPFRDVFSSIFFVSIGMLLDLRGAWAARGIIPFMIAVAIVLKFATGFLAVRALRHPPRIAFLSGLGLVPLGEFSFVLSGIGRDYGLLSESSFQAFIATSILTILVTPFLIDRGPGWWQSLSRLFRLDEAAPPPAVAKAKPENHVIVAGYGLNGRTLARVLKASGIGYVILELNPDTVREALAGGEPIIFGDVTSPTILREANVAKAKALVFAVSDPKAAERGARAARAIAPDVFIVVRTRYAAHADRLYAAGADTVIPMEFEASIEIYTRVLEIFHVPKNLIDAQTRLLRGERYGILRGEAEPGTISGKLAEILAAGTVEPFLVGSGSTADGKTLKTLDLRRQTGATVIAVVRGEKTFKSPSPDLKIAAGDTLVLVASHADMDRAFRFLT